MMQRSSASTFALPDPPEHVAPVLVTQGVVEQIMRGQATTDFARRLREAYLAVSRNRDLLVVEGANTWAEGSVVDLSADQVSDMLEAPVLLVTLYRSPLSLDAMLAVQRYLGDRLLGILINEVEAPKLDFVRNRVVPFLEQRGVPVFAVLPQDPQLASVTVADLYEFLGGQMIGDRSGASARSNTL